MTQRSFWNALGDFCTELAPVIGPLVSVVGETAHAVDRASTDQRKLIYTTEERVALPAPRKRTSAKKSRTKAIKSTAS